MSDFGSRRYKNGILLCLVDHDFMPETTWQVPERILGAEVVGFHLPLSACCRFVALYNSRQLTAGPPHDTWLVITRRGHRPGPGMPKQFGEDLAASFAAAGIDPHFLRNGTPGPIAAAVTPSPIHPLTSSPLAGDDRPIDPELEVTPAYELVEGCA